MIDRAWVKLATTAGVSAAIAVYFVIWVTSDLSAKVEAHNTRMNVLATSFDAFTDEQRDVNREQSRILFAICYNLAGADETKQARCEGRRAR